VVVGLNGCESEAAILGRLSLHHWQGLSLKLTHLIPEIMHTRGNHQLRGEVIDGPTQDRLILGLGLDIWLWTEKQIWFRRLDRRKSRDGSVALASERKMICVSVYFQRRMCVTGAEAARFEKLICDE
jgi:hypothetical protein